MIIAAFYSLCVKRLSHSLLPSFALLLIACAADQLENTSLVGLSKQEIVQRYGEPAEIRDYVKQSEEMHMLGPPETLWHEMMAGDTLTIWKIESVVGDKYVYFVNADDMAKLDSFSYHDETKNPVY